MNEFITVYGAEIMRRLRSRIFVLGIVIGALGIVGIMKLPSFMQSVALQSDRIVLAGDPKIVAAAAGFLRKDYAIAGRMPGIFRITSSDLRARPNAAAILVLRRDTQLRVTVYARDPGNVNAAQLRRDLLPLSLQIFTGLSTRGITAALKTPVRIVAMNSKFGTATQSADARIIAYLLLFVLYLLIMMNSQLIMSSVAEEKTSRIAELLVASVNPNALLAGKIAASGTIAIAQMIAWVGVAFAVGASGAAAVSPEAVGRMGSFSFSLSSVSGATLAGFAVFFLLGYLQMATLFAAVGSLVNRTEDLGSLAGPLVIPVVAAFIIAIAALGAPDAGFVVGASFVPIIAPFVMFARIGVSSVPMWQVALSLAINVAATWGIAILAGKIYRVGMLLYGRTPKFSQIFAVLKS